MRSANSTRLLIWGALLFGAGADAQERKAEVRLLVQSSPLAGLRYYAAPEVAQALRVGDGLELVRERDNPHDANAIAVIWRARKLGYLPRRDNATLAWGLDRGERLHARIGRLAPPPRPARRVEVEVYIE